MSCSYDCSKRLTVVSPYPDISGIGVVVGYVTTAGIAVFIIIAYYFISYQPEVDPFERPTDPRRLSDRVPFKPNPIDTILLRSFRRIWWGAVPKGARAQRVQSALVKCILNMSDLQIVTGISILVSGYAQLRCGLSTYHWQIMVWEAFFSSLTHMSCLTFLRSYLHHYPGQRLWRLIGMLTIAGLLFTAMLPTYNFNLSKTFPNPNTFLPRPADQTICFFRPGHMSPGHRGGERTVASMVLLVVGFFFRSIRLFESASTGVLARMEQSMGAFVVRKLEAIYVWCDLQNAPYSLSRTLVYWPLLATRWSIKVGWDFTTSMYFEVLFLGFSFGWATGQLSSDLGVANGGNSDWTFGQIVPIVVLAAPLIAIIEFFFPDDGEYDQKPDRIHNMRPRSGTLSPIDHKSPMAMELSTPLEYDDGVNDGPSQNLYDQWPFAAAVLLLPVLVATLAVATIGKLITWRLITANIGLSPFFFSIFIIFSFGMERLSRKFPKGRAVFKIIPFLSFTPFIVENFSSIFLHRHPDAIGEVYAVSLAAVMVLTVLYILGSFCVWCVFSIRVAMRKPDLPTHSESGNPNGVSLEAHDVK